MTLSPVSIIPIRERKWIDVDTPPFDHSCFAVSKVMIRLLRHGTSIPREDDEAVRFEDLVKEFEAKFYGPSHWSVNARMTYLAKGGGQKKRFHYCLNPNSSKLFLFFKAIQGHSGNNLVDPALQDNVLLPDDFTEYNCHAGNVSEQNSIIRSGLIPGGKCLEGDRQSVFFTAVNPMNDDQGMEEIRCDLDKPRIVPYKSTWRPHQNTVVYWCNLKLAQRKGLHLYQTRSHAIVLCNTLPAICIEKAVCMKTDEELYHKVCQPPRFPRIMLKPNSQSGQQDQPDQKAGTSSDHQSASGSCGRNP